ncbi:MAG TPA: aminoglycoside phosphotransferase family protein [Bauldia sp.]|nr:aminoglycoside phosphotransferase family protein [Bauldia sp.]
MTVIPDDIIARLVRIGLAEAGEPVLAERLTGGVSSDIWKVTAGGRVFCVKRAMAKLAVKDDWFAPVERNRYERQWYELASARVPGAAPRVLAHDDDAMFFVMEWLDPREHRLWKAELMSGRVDLQFASAVGMRLAAIHAATAGEAAVAAMFPTGSLFEALRLEPYLRATGRRHPALAPALDALADRTARTNLALVHGDASPKNIMAGPAGPVFLDAECAWYGDPAFDLAFCLNHLLLKCLVVPAESAVLLVAFDELRDGYLCGVTWEERSALERRAASLLPGLFLARVDGKSPVEYLTRDEERDRVRGVALPLIEQPPETLAAVRDAWGREVGVE